MVSQWYVRNAPKETFRKTIDFLYDVILYNIRIRKGLCGGIRAKSEESSPVFLIDYYFYGGTVKDIPSIADEVEILFVN